MIGVRGPAHAWPRTCGRRLAYACCHLISPRRLAGHRGSYCRSSAPPPGRRAKSSSIPAAFPPERISATPSRKRCAGAACWSRSSGRSGSAARHGAPKRINDPDDPVRMEIATALDDGLPIIPVLVNGASMPAASELPDDVEGLRLSQCADHRPRPQFPSRRRRARPRDRGAGPASRLAAPDGRGAGGGRGGVSRRLDRGTAVRVARRCGASWRRRRRATSKSRRSACRRAGGELNYIRQKVERNFVDLFSDAKLRVRASLTTNQSLAQLAFHARRRDHRAVRAGHGHCRAARRARPGGGFVADRGRRLPSSKRSTRSSRKR